MRLNLSIALLLLPLARAGQIIETHDPTLGQVALTPKRLHSVTTRLHILPYSLEMMPYIKTIDGISKIGILLTVGQAEVFFYSGQLIIVADGKQVLSAARTWAVTSTLLHGHRSETAIDNDPAILRTMAGAHELYVNVLFSEKPASKDRLKFRVSPEQQKDIQLILDRYGASP